MHYHVFSGTKGCLPERATTSRTFKEALADALELRRACVDDGATAWVGSLRRDWYTEPRNAQAAGLEYIEIVECYEPDCEKELDEH